MRGKRSADCNIDLGLEISACSLKFGETRTQVEIAAFCGCTPQAIDLIEKKALRKLRKALFLRKNPELLDLIEHYAPRFASGNAGML